MSTADKASDGRVLVYARVRPPSPEEETAGLAAQCSEQGIRVVGGTHDGNLNPAQGTSKDFIFDGVFDGSSTQTDVFNKVGNPVLQELLRGINGAILAYGQTGSGKTFSLLHQGRVSSEAGLLSRLVAALFAEVERLSDSLFDIQAAALQVYNEQVDDLLHPGHDSGQGCGLSVLNAGVVPGLTWKSCNSPDELLGTFDAARANLVYAETKMNKASSRSHAVFQIHLARRTWAPVAANSSSEPSGGGVLGSSQRVECRTSRLSIVDLAGSERVKKSGVEGAQFKEATAINKSLLSLGNVVSALAAKKPHVPMRESKLTRILDGSIGGNCRTVLLVCASPSMSSAQETLSTFEFASRAMRVEVDARVNCSIVEVDSRTLLKDLSREQAAREAQRVAELREEANAAGSALKSASAEVEATREELRQARSEGRRHSEQCQALETKSEQARELAQHYESSAVRSNEELVVARDVAADSVAQAELLAMQLATEEERSEAMRTSMARLRGEVACEEEEASRLAAEVAAEGSHRKALQSQWKLEENTMRSSIQHGVERNMILEEEMQASRAEVEEQRSQLQEAEQQLASLRRQAEEAQRQREEELQELEEARSEGSRLATALQESTKAGEQGRRAAREEVEELRELGAQQDLDHKRAISDMKRLLEVSAEASLQEERTKWMEEVAELRAASRAKVAKVEELQRQTSEAAEAASALFQQETRQRSEAFEEERSTWEAWMQQSQHRFEAAEGEQRAAAQALQSRLDAQKASVREESKACSSLSKEVSEKAKLLRNRESEVQELRSERNALKQGLEKRESDESNASKAAAQQAARLRKAMADLRAAKAEVAEREVELTKLRRTERSPDPSEEHGNSAALAAERLRWAERSEAQEGEVEDLRRKLQNRDENDRIFGKASHRQQAQRLGNVPNSVEKGSPSVASTGPPESRKPPALSSGRNGVGCRTPSSAGVTPVANSQVGRSWSARRCGGTPEPREQRDPSPLRAASAEVLRRNTANTAKT